MKLNFWFKIIILSIFIIIIQPFIPWWAISIVFFIAGFLLIKKPGHAFIGGILAGFISWVILAYFQDFNTSVSISGTVGNILGGLSPIFVYLITGIIGGIIGGMSSMSGTLLRKIWL